jgi:pyridoxamine 5'-phosphate oxidase-like protein
MDTVQWSEFAEANETLAHHVQKRLSGGIAYFATVRADGWPRLHPLGVIFRDGKCLVVMYPNSPKGHDLRRNGHYAVHCTVEDDTGGGGEVLLSGVAIPSDPTESDVERGWIAFELLVGEVLATTYDSAQQRPISERWRPAAGRTVG